MAPPPPKSDRRQHPAAAYGLAAVFTVLFIYKAAPTVRTRGPGAGPHGLPAVPEAGRGV
eukprot:gene9161-8252_t